ncbi:MAG: hypothetical protein ACM3MB_09340 [Acidobacteriota bacterium]
MNFFYLRKGFLIGLTVMLLTASCASTKTLYVWKDEGHRQRLGRTLIIVVAELDYMRDHFENVLAGRLGDRSIDAVPSNKVMPQMEAKPDREAIAAKVRELGFENVIVARVISKDEYSKLIPGGVYLVPEAYYSGWYPFYADSFSMAAVPGTAYDAEFFTIVTNIYDVRSDKLVWSYLSRVKVETSRQGAINPFVETIMKQLEKSQLL